MALTRTLPVAAALLGSLALAVLASRVLAPACPWAPSCLLPPESAPHAALRWAVALVLLTHGLLIPGWLLASAVGVPPLVRLGCAPLCSGLAWAASHALLHLLSVPRAGLPVILCVAGVEVVALALAARTPRGSIPTWGEAVAVSAGLCTILLFGPSRISLQSLDGDGVEAFGFASSLKTHLLPHWDLENGTWGFYPAFMSFAYPLRLSMALLGESEAAVRLPVVALGAALAGLLGAHRERILAAGLMGGAVLVVATSGFNYTYEPYAADLAEPTVTDLWFALALLVMAWAWGERRVGTFCAGALVAISGQPAGVPFAALLVGIGLWQKETRAFALRAAGVLGACVLVQALVGSLANPPGATKFSPATFLAHHTKGPSVRLGGRQIATQLWAFLVQTAGAPVLFAAPLCRSARHNPRRRAVLLATAVYLLAVTLSPKRHPHYLTPVACLVLFLLPPHSPSARPWLAFVALCLAGVVPLRPCPPDTRPAAFGRATLMVVSSEREAVENADLLYRVLTVPPWRDESTWGIGKHAWVAYATRVDSLPPVPPPGIHVLMAPTPEAWPRFVPVTDNGRAFLFEHPEGWMEAWRVQGGEVRCWGELLKVPFRLWDPISRWKA